MKKGHAGKTKPQFIKELEELPQQVTDLNNSENMTHKLEASELRYRRLFEAARDGILILDADTGQITDVNPFLINMLGYPLEGFMGKRLWEIGPFKDIEASQEAFRELQSKGYIRYENLPLETKNGLQISVEFVSNVYLINGDRVIQCNIRDITERVHAEEELSGYRDQLEKIVEQRTAELKKANRKLEADIIQRKKVEEALRGSEEKWHSLVENAPNMIMLTDREDKIQFMNRTVSGFDIEDVIGKSIYDYTQPEHQNEVNQAISRVLESGKASSYEIRGFGSDGNTSWYNTRVGPIQRNGEVTHLIHIISDITERKQTEEELIETREYLENLIDYANAPIIVWNLDFTISRFNHAFERLTQWSAEEVTGKKLDILFPEETCEESLEHIRNTIAGRRWEAVEIPILSKDGSVHTLLWNSAVLFEPDGKTVRATIAQGQDITERKWAEEALKANVKALAASEKRYSTIFESAAEGMLIADTETKQFKYANPAICRMLGYSQEELKEMAIADIHPMDSLEHVFSEFEAQAKGEKILSEGLPCLRKNGAILYADVKMAGALLDGTQCAIGFFTDVTERRLAEEGSKQNTEKLLKAMGDTIKVMAMTVEIKDPYTSGHQQRVSRLATSIAQEMELPAEQIEGIRIAGVVHDIGKMYVPSEILSKPGRINEIEFEMIKMHPKAGYDILKIVEFPWPVAQTVLQHHERMDGSGYPGHLLGKDIILEARILAVADVVEAMASHRPYRPALGVDKALDEISQKGGVLYDSAVVDACLKLFNEKGFNFDGEI